MTFFRLGTYTVFSPLKMQLFSKIVLSKPLKLGEAHASRPHLFRGPAGPCVQLNSLNFTIHF